MEQIKRIAESFVVTNGLFSHQRRSYDEYVTHHIQGIIKENSPINCVCDGNRQLVYMYNVRISKPVIKCPDGFIKYLSPKQALQQGKNYLADVFIDVKHEVYDKDVLRHVHTYTNILFFQIPCMWNSSLCNDARSLTTLREQGAFIINGYQKTIISQETLKCNYPYVTPVKKQRFTHVCELRSNHPSKIRSTSTLYVYIGNQPVNVLVQLPFAKYYVPVVVIMRTLGVDSLQDMFDILKGQEPSQRYTHLLKMILYTDTSGTSRMSLNNLYNWIGLQGDKKTDNRRKRIKAVANIMNNEFLPHCSSPLEKTFYFAYCVRKLCKVYLGEVSTDDIDSYQNKRLTLPGNLLALLTRQLVRKFMKTLQNKIFRNEKGRPIRTFFQHARITSGLSYAMRTGSWGIQRGVGNQTGICQPVNTLNINSSNSHKRQVNTPLNRDGKMAERRQLHLHDWGVICSAETPEGKSVGLTSTLAFLCQVRGECPSHYVTAILYEELNVYPLAQKVPNAVLVILNGLPCGFTLDAPGLCQKYRQYRQYHNVPQNSSISIVHGEVIIDMDQGDCYRPLLVCSKAQTLREVYQRYQHLPHVLWQRLLLAGCIEYVNKVEEGMYNVSIESLLLHDPGPRYTHTELHSSLAIFGLSAGAIPFAAHNQAPRNIYQAAMSKQAISPYMLGHHHNLDKKTMNLCYAQRPLVQTMTSQLSGELEAPAGQSVLVAIQCFTGYNQEDACIINRAAIDRGLFATTITRVVKDSEANHGNDIERFSLDSSAIGRLAGSYEHIGDDGIAKIGSIVHKGDVLISKNIEYTRFGSERKTRDRSTQAKNDYPATVDLVATHLTEQKLRRVAVRTSEFRSVQVGDKFASRFAQKGVVGLIVPPEDMPFQADGVSPEMIINPHSFPSRMTIGHLIEMLGGKAACLSGEVVDGTAFSTFNDEDFKKHLRAAGISVLGKEYLRDGRTGERLKYPVYMGVIYIQRLRHMALDKGHARSVGRVQIRTRQALEGRSRCGGLRIGEMERDVFISHGCSSVLIDRLLEQSDEFETVCCTTCGFLAIPASDQSPAYCNYCQSQTGVKNIRMPYACKLLYQELQACNINMKLS